MDSYEVVRYSANLYDEWNNFVLTSKNATFLFHRDFMGYHQDRFEDFSLMVYHKNKLVCVFPANINANKLHSHQGLSYGGLILPSKSSFNSVLESLYSILKFSYNQNIKSIILKQLPRIYHLRPSDELDYLLFILKAKSNRKDISMTISLNKALEFSALRKRQLKTALQNDLKIKLEVDFTAFWNDVLVPNLKLKFGVKPVHSLFEINALHEKFPNNIKQYNVYLKDEILAGCTVFETENVAHLQYISTKKDKNIGALDFLINKLISEVYKDKEYFDFGISNENKGKNINLGLLNWKQSFGASAIVHDFYEVETKNYQLLKDIFI
ncbi:GNAT family N-acetyltransferase [Gaetbulibacter sp. M235]|uniref:GNAT family N-acetyltransferase n=1 Tax=Gaetbulibacter sp. M235 TaxID=3126510 RepID=UPI00374F61A1